MEVAKVVRVVVVGPVGPLWVAVTVVGTVVKVVTTEVAPLLDPAEPVFDSLLLPLFVPVTLVEALEPLTLPLGEVAVTDSVETNVDVAKVVKVVVVGPLGPV
ncbi:hypothetical protein K7432_007032 [Basidiobolus ranarum]|uniref:Secreted protein n=1 Tax=Basidiobolus ranarum TaxID=34480 RepID=A0ABR2WTX2_9FUNG